LLAVRTRTKLHFALLKPIPPPQGETTEARRWVAAQLGLPYHDDMQDWPWEVADAACVEDYVALYMRAAVVGRVVLMEMLLQAATAQRSSKKLRLAWEKIEPLLNQNADLHAATAQYWCLWDYQGQGFRVSPYVRAWWIANYPIPNNLADL
jgi:hypothetical protein